MIEEKRKPGRPRKYAGNRPTWTVRLPASLGDEIVEAAKAEGRSISEEIEHRVVQYSQWRADQAFMQKMRAEYADVHARANSELRNIQQNQDEYGARLEELGFTLILMRNGDKAWLEPGSKSLPTSSLLQAMMTADQMAPILQQAVIDAYLLNEERARAYLNEKRENDEG